MEEVGECEATEDGTGDRYRKRKGGMVRSSSKSCAAEELYSRDIARAGGR